jgi:hypothetical protein
MRELHDLIRACALKSRSGMSCLRCNQPGCGWQKLNKSGATTEFAPYFLRLGFLRLSEELPASALKRSRSF